MADIKTAKVPYLKKDCKIKMEIGAQMVQHLHGLTVWVMEEHKDKAQDMQKKIENKQPLEPWESAVVVLTQFLKACGEQAEKDGNIYYKDGNELINGNSL